MRSGRDRPGAAVRTGAAVGSACRAAVGMPGPGCRRGHPGAALHVHRERPCLYVRSGSGAVRADRAASGPAAPGADQARLLAEAIRIRLGSGHVPHVAALLPVLLFDGAGVLSMLSRPARPAFWLLSSGLCVAGFSYYGAIGRPIDLIDVHFGERYAFVPEAWLCWRWPEPCPDRFRCRSMGCWPGRSTPKPAATVTPGRSSRMDRRGDRKWQPGRRIPRMCCVCSRTAGACGWPPTIIRWLSPDSSEPGSRAG